MFKNRKWHLLNAAIVTFLAYTSVYAFRKPFSVASYEGIHFYGINYKSLLIIFQSVGYLLSKLSGIVIISSQKKEGRWKMFALLIIIAWLSLYFLAIVPPPFGIFCLLVNGYMLGFTWGIVFSYIEGKQSTDIIGAAMSVSFIFAGGFTRSVAIFLKNQWSVPENWLAFDVGLIFIVPLLFLMYLLEKIPKPSHEDVDLRSNRMPMSKSDRLRILKDYGFGLFLMIFIYVMLTILRDIRDNYMSDMWIELGYSKSGGLLTQTETITSILVLFFMGMIVLIKNNQKALKIIHYFIAFGFIIAAVGSFFYLLGFINGIIWMQLVGLGIYLAYIPFNCVYFERFIASYKIVGNVGFLMYLSDTYGYLGSLGVLLTKEMIHIKISWVNFYMYLVFVFAIIGIMGLIIAMKYFNVKFKTLQLNET